jgi:hypothetical protein
MVAVLAAHLEVSQESQVQMVAPQEVPLVALALPQEVPQLEVLQLEVLQLAELLEVVVQLAELLEVVVQLVVPQEELPQEELLVLVL